MLASLESTNILWSLEKNVQKETSVHGLSILIETGFVSSINQQYRCQSF